MSEHEPLSDGAIGIIAEAMRDTEYTEYRVPGHILQETGAFINSLQARIAELESPAPKPERREGEERRKENRGRGDDYELDQRFGLDRRKSQPKPLNTYNLVAHLARQREWSEKTFGPGERTAGVLDHIRKELAEIEENPNDLEEWIDVVILALDGAWRVGGTPDTIALQLAMKQEKNEAREWPDWQTAASGKAIEHVRAESPVPVYSKRTAVQGVPVVEMPERRTVEERRKTPYGDISKVARVGHQDNRRKGQPKPSASVGEIAERLANEIDVVFEGRVQSLGESLDLTLITGREPPVLTFGDEIKSIITAAITEATAPYIERGEEVQRLVRRIDVVLCGGAEKAAPRPTLIDVLKQAETVMVENAKLREAAVWVLNGVSGVSRGGGEVDPNDDEPKTAFAALRDALKGE